MKGAQLLQLQADGLAFGYLAGSVVSSF